LFYVPMNSTVFASYLRDVKGKDKLQSMKLLYYAQGLHKILSGRALFQDDIERWDKGPVPPDSYHGWEKLVPVPLDFVTMHFLDRVVGALPLDGVALMRKSHGESPWQEFKRNEVMKLDAIVQAFKEKPPVPLDDFVDTFFLTLMKWTPGQLEKHRILGNYPLATFMFCKSWFQARDTGIIARAWPDDEDEEEAEEEEKERSMDVDE